MATYSTGISATWGSVTFTEVTGLSWTYGGENVGRSANFNPNPGSVSVTALGTVPSIGVVGNRGTITITGGGMNLTQTAVLDSVSAAAEVNGVTLYTVEFTLLDN
ncbi:MAG: hypothetical protein EBR82_34675 [Caulobacteraceae bacterium]|nr:hypothetical protein [Caulobacteraceae bacterium]